MTKHLVTIAIFLSLTTVGYFGIGSLLQTADSANTSPIPITTTSSKSTFTLSDIASHNSISDCYLVIRGDVYDVTSYSGSHPGGVMSISGQCGKEAGSIFTKIHSNHAWDLLANYKIGTLAK